jgi:DNA polymerase I
VSTCIVDIETESLTPKKIHCIVTRTFPGDEVQVFTNLHSDPEERTRWAAFVPTVTTWVAHNGISFDVPVINRLSGAKIGLRNVVDTVIVSRLQDSARLGGHSLEAWGERLGFPKSYFKAFEALTQEMIDYCIQDTLVTAKLFKKLLPFIKDPKNKAALRVEHDMQMICSDMSANGFYFDADGGRARLDQIHRQMKALEDEFQVCFPPQLVEVNRIKYRVKANGELYKNVADAYAKYALVLRDGDDLVCKDYQLFDPASPKQRIDRLWEAGWKPKDMTKGHKDFLRERSNDPDRKAKFERYGWECSENNLATLPHNAPDGAKALAEWLTLEGRRNMLTQWLGAFNEETHRIHGSFMGIGSWTGRMSHNRPNAANIFSPANHPFKKDGLWFAEIGDDLVELGPDTLTWTEAHDAAHHWRRQKADYRSPIDRVKGEFDGPLRALWGVPPGRWQVGTDAEGIQLRILAHTLGNEAYTFAIANGKKEDKTDIHNVNMRALGSVCKSRNDAKTFIYAWLLGATAPKVADILGCTTREAEKAMNDFMDNIEGLRKLKSWKIPQWAKKGGFTGLDGRFVVCRAERLILAGILQNGESCVMKHANILWRTELKSRGIWFRQINFVHDEWQTECLSRADAEVIGEVQRWSIEEVGRRLNVQCPLAGSTDIGDNWASCH